MTIARAALTQGNWGGLCGVPDVNKAQKEAGEEVPEPSGS